MSVSDDILESSVSDDILESIDRRGSATIAELGCDMPGATMVCIVTKLEGLVRAGVIEELPLPPEPGMRPSKRYARVPHES